MDKYGLFSQVDVNPTIAQGGMMLKRHGIDSAALLEGFCFARSNYLEAGRICGINNLDLIPELKISNFQHNLLRHFILRVIERFRVGLDILILLQTSPNTSVECHIFFMTIITRVINPDYSEFAQGKIREL